MVRFDGTCVRATDRSIVIRVERDANRTTNVALFLPRGRDRVGVRSGQQIFALCWSRWKKDSDGGFELVFEVDRLAVWTGSQWRELAAPAGVGDDEDH